MIIILDGYCEFCKRVGKWIQRFNVMGWLYIRYTNQYKDDSILKQHGIDGSIKNIVGIKINGKMVFGAYCWREIFLRLPVCWLWVWIMYLPFSMVFCNKIYKYIRDNRYCIVKCKNNCKIK